MKTKVLITSIFLFFLTFNVVFSQPTDNPYKSRYGTNDRHWTDSIKWSSIFNVSDYGAIANDGNDDLSAINSAIAAAFANNGGVVYFPSGTYNISDDLYLKSGVIIRGADPSISDAQDDNYNPPSKLVFPQYVPSFTGSGTDNSTAFKSITRSAADSNINNIGIVNLDVNRAMVSFHPNFKIVGNLITDKTESDWQPTSTNRNCIVMGIRSNNTAIPDPGVPTTSQNQWQRYPWRFAANIDLFFFANVVVCNNRVNDNPSDNYDQPGYLAQDGTLWPAVPVDSLAKFRYTDHYGISVNRAKIVKDKISGIYSIKPFWWYAYPWQEPYLFAQGVEIMDNWVLTTMRIKITSSGLGLKVKNNITRDKSGKVVYLTPDGKKKQTNYGATYENRGMDFSGWNDTIIDNDVWAYRHTFYGQSYQSICGEGIMNQGNSGGTTVNGVLMKNNLVTSNATTETNPAFTLYKTGSISNVLVEGNQPLGANKFFFFSADQNTSIHYMTNVTIRNNTGTGKIRVVGTKGGSLDSLYNNDGSGDLIYDSYWYLANNGSLNDPFPANQVDTVSISGKFAYPSKNMEINHGTNFIFKLALKGGSADSVRIYDVNKAWLGKATITGDTATLNWTANGYGKHYITADIYKNGDRHSWVPIVVLEVLDLSTKEKKTFTKQETIVYPVPAQSSLTVILPVSSIGSEIQVISSLGSIVYSDISSSTTHVLNIENLERGIYILKTMVNGKAEYTKFIKK